MNFLGTLASLCLLALTKSKITATMVYNVTVTHEDKFQFNLNSIFDFS